MAAIASCPFLLNSARCPEIARSCSSSLFSRKFLLISIFLFDFKYPKGSLQALPQIVPSCEFLLHSLVEGERRYVEVCLWNRRQLPETFLTQCLSHVQGFCRSVWPRSLSIWSTQPP